MLEQTFITDVVIGRRAVTKDTDEPEKREGLFRGALVRWRLLRRASARAGRMVWRRRRSPGIRW